MEILREKIRMFWHRRKETLTLAFFAAALALASYALGYRAASEKNVVPIIIEKNSEQ